MSCSAGAWSTSGKRELEEETRIWSGIRWREREVLEHRNLEERRRRVNEEGSSADDGSARRKEELSIRKEDLLGSWKASSIALAKVESRWTRRPLRAIPLSKLGSILLLRLRTDPVWRSSVELQVLPAIPSLDLEGLRERKGDWVRMGTDLDLDLRRGWEREVGGVELVVRETRGRSLGRDDELEDATEVGRQVG